MKVKFYKDNQQIIFGITYDKNLHVDGEHALTFSFGKWDIVFSWN